MRGIAVPTMTLSSMASSIAMSSPGRTALTVRWAAVSAVSDTSDIAPCPRTYLSTG